MFSLIKRLNYKDYLLIILSTIFIVLSVYLDLKLPEYMSEITKIITNPNPNQSLLWQNGGYMLLCALGSAVISVLIGFIFSKMAASISLRLREDIYDKVQSFSMEEMNKFSTASLITRSTNDITQIQNIFSTGLQFFIKAPILGVWAVIKILGKSYEWSIATAVSVGVLFLTIIIIGSLILPRFKKVQKLTDDLNNLARENLTGVRVIRAFNAENYQEDKFDRTNTELTKNTLFNHRVIQVMSPMMNLVLNVLNITIYFIGAFLINNASGFNDKLVLFSDMIIFSSYAMQVVMAFIMITMVFILLPRASVSATRINEVLNTKSKIENGNTILSNKVGEIEFNNVSFISRCRRKST
jgi:ATP-binding cassette, subfamily B, multidrug efflux pump